MMNEKPFKSTVKVTSIVIDLKKIVESRISVENWA